jgi:ADP-ribose pyrophosphatase YjhB (NUDIX family)
MEPHAGEWSLPIGLLHFGETAEQAAIRDAAETAGLRIEASALIGTYNDVINEQRNHLVLIFRCRLLGGELRPGGNAQEATWFSEKNLPPIAFSSAQSAIQSWLAERNGPPTAFYFCPRCRSKLERRKVGNREHPACATCDWIHWINAIPVVETIVTNTKGHLVLIKRRFPPRIGDWALPGGHLDWGESAEEAAIREVREETGLEIRLVRLLCTMGLPSLLNPEQCVLKTIFIGELVGGELKASDDALDAQFFPPEDLPKNIAMESTREALRKWRSGG